MGMTEMRKTCPQLSEFSVRLVGAESRDGGAVSAMVADVVIVAESLHSRRAGAYFLPETRLSWTDEYETGVSWEYRLDEGLQWVDPLDTPIHKRADGLALLVDDVAKPSVLHPAALRRYCTLAEATALLARAWTPSDWRTLVGGLSGVLVQAGWEIPAISRLLSAVCAVAGDDVERRLDEEWKVGGAGFHPLMGSPHWRTVLRDLVGDQAVERVIGALELRLGPIGT